MKNFTIGQIRGNASKVLAICDRDKCVRITRPDGRSYILKRIEPEEHRPKHKRYALTKAVIEARKEFKSGRLGPGAPSEILRRIGASNAR